MISLGIGQAGRGMVDYHRQLLLQAQAAGNSVGSEPVMGENLAAIGYGWIAENSSTQQVIDRLALTTTQYLFAVGITGQSAIQGSSNSAPYVDLPLNRYRVTPQNSGGPTIAIGGNTYPVAIASAFLALEEASSSLKSGVLEQTQAPVIGATAASTIKIVDSNMNSAYPGALNTTYFADGTTTSGQNTYTNTILPAITGQYNASDLSQITAAVNGGQQILIPSNGKLAIGLWTGGGFTTIAPLAGGDLVVGQIITGGMSGGFFGQADANSPNNTAVTIPQAANTGTTISLVNTIPSPSNPVVAEPVDGVTGAYLYDHTDLVTGGGNFPYALPFSRTYQSAAGSWLTTPGADTGMGNAWRHSYAITAQVQSDPYIALGPSDTPAVNAANTAAALYVMQDLLSVTPTAQTMTISSMVAHWYTDQLDGNVVMVTQPNTTEEFVALPHADGATAISYIPPPASSVRFNQVAAGQFTYQTKDGQVLSFGPSPAGALQSWTFPNGMAVNLGYSGSRLATVANTLGRSLTLSYAGDDVSAVTDETGRSATYGYDANHNLMAATDPLGNTTRFAYDSSGTYDTLGRLTQIFYPFNPGAFVTNWYDALGRVGQQADASGHVSNLYFASSRSEIVDALGNRHVTYQTDRGRTVKDDWVLDGGALSTCPGQGLNTAQNVFSDTAQCNGVVNVTASQYDGLDRLVQTTLPERGSTSYAYAATVNPWANNLASVTRPAKPGSPLAPLVTRYDYDGTWNKPTSVTDPLGLVATMAYDRATGNLLASIADAGGTGHYNARSSYTYNAYGQVLTATDPLGVVTAYGYDGAGNQISVVRDVAGLHQATAYTHSALGDVVSVTDPNGNVTTSTYDADRRLATVTGPAAAQVLVTAYTYDPDGHLLRTQQSSAGLSRTTSATYTPTGKTATTTDANGNVTTYAYDVDDRLSAVTDPLLRITVYGYDALGRQVSVGNPAISATPLVRYAYTPDGLQASLTDATGNTTGNAYDGVDRLSSMTWPNGTTEAYTYDADGNRLTRKTRKGDTLTYTYDTLNHLASKAAPGEATVTYAYDPGGRLVGVSDTSAALALPTTGASYVTTRTYDPLNRPLTVGFSPAPAQAAPSPSSVTFAHSYDATNRRIGQSVSDSSWLLQPATAGTTTYTPNALNQYGQVGAVTPSYDGNGSLTGDGTFTYGYDAENRLVSVTGGGVTAAYAYDAQGRRKSKTVNGTTTVYLTDADGREVVEYAGAGGATAAWYAYGLGANEVLAQMNAAAGTRATMIPDIQGSLIGTLNSGTGALTKVGYLAFGENPAAYAGATFRYTGQRLDPETGGSASQPSGLYDYRARAYSPTLGRFLQPDPAGYSAGANLYAYVSNDPLNLTDPTGLVQDGASAGFNFTTQAYDVSAVGLWNSGTAANRAGIVVGAAAGLVYGYGQELVAGAAAARLFGAAQTAGTVVEGLTAAERVAQLAENGLSQIQRERFVTLAVTETKEGVRVISSSSKTLEQSVINLLQEGEVGVSGIGHAEVTGVEGAQSLGLTPTGVAASRPICPSCANYLSEQGIAPLTPLKQ
ncbi:RHS repeat-associated core domain-containing protein [Nitrospirillum sp. BR 11163]|uniref:RHS repeat-associated core domain-containing protein n=1 Tax=Nitrospirillum sp. BR 11163 TaxID=3104323 RepID=UPI002AFF999B|nr:RHS repeat-associated core domain-containing protein [Nitrospirillum sp. BR 11163]MEA1677476.1 RHS repeat-associated core domain-containing protein [Nitrospirillum sp. BR 11163]